MGKVISDKRQVMKRRKNPLPFILGFIWLILSGFPIYYMVMTSLKSQAGYLSGDIWLPPTNPEFNNYVTVFQKGIGTAFLNSVIVSVITVFLIVIVSVCCSYVIVRTKTPVVQTTFKVLLVGLAVPIQAAIIPVYILIIKLGLYDSLAALILPSVAFAIPLSVLILVNFIRDIPNSLYESMQLDGISDIGLVFRLVFPLSKPAITTVAIYQFIMVWNNFLFPLVLTQSKATRVLPLEIVSFKGEFSINVPLLMTAVIISAAPLILAYIFGRRLLLEGFASGFGK